MNILIKLNIAVWLSVLVLSMPAYAERNVNNNNCNGRGSCAPGGGGNEQHNRRHSLSAAQILTYLKVVREVLLTLGLVVAVGAIVFLLVTHDPTAALARLEALLQQLVDSQ